MPFVRAMVDPKSGAALSSAYGVVSNWDLQGKAQIARVTLDWFASAEVHAAGFAAVQTDTLTLSDVEQAQGVNQLLGVLEAIIHARDTYKSAGSL